MDNCSFCENERFVYTWRDWTRIVREIGGLKKLGIDWREALWICREAKNGYKGFTGHVWHSVDCPACFE